MSGIQNPTPYVLLVIISLLMLSCEQTGVAPDDIPEPGRTLQVREATDGYAFYDYYQKHAPSSATTRAYHSDGTASSPKKISQQPYSCYMSRYISGQGYYYKSVYLDFPKAITDGNEGGQLGVVRWIRTNKEIPHPSHIEAMIICRIPQTREAADMVLDYFGLQRNSAEPRNHAPRSDHSAVLNDDSQAYASDIAGTAPAYELASVEEQVFFPVLDGRILNDEGYICMDGTNWLTYDQEHCTDGTGLLPGSAGGGHGPGRSGQRGRRKRARRQ